MRANPYLAPIEPEEAAGLTSFQANELHRRRIRELRSIALFYYLLAAAIAISCISLMVFDTETSFHLKGAALFALTCVGLVSIGRALKSGKQWARYLTILFSIPCLLVFPVGSILGFHVLSTLLSQEAKELFAQSNREVSLIESTARPEGATHPVIKSLLYVLLAVVLLIVVPALLLAWLK